MAQRIGTLREAFDPTCDFVVVKPLTYGGLAYSVNQMFDKGIVDKRRLRQLYDGRYLRQVEPEYREEVEVELPPVVMGNMLRDVVVDEDTPPLMKKTKVKKAKKKR